MKKKKQKQKTKNSNIRGIHDMDREYCKSPLMTTEIKINSVPNEK